VKKHELNIKNMMVSGLKPNPKNPRMIDEESLGGLSESISKFGLVEPIIVNEKTGFIVGGHQRLKALQKIGIDSVDIVVVNLSEKEEMELNVALNNKSIQGTWTDGVIEILEDIKVNFSEDFEVMRFDSLLEEVSLDFDVEDGCDEVDENSDDIPDVNKKEAITKRGDLWEIGKHKLLCGDSTSVDDIERLMGDETADCLMTDPPYGVDYSAKNEFLNNRDKGNRIQKEIANDAIENYREWFGSFLSIIPFSDYNVFYIWMSGLELHNLRLAIEDCGYKCGDYLVWVKNNHVLGRKDYNSKHEFCVYGWKNHHKFYGDFATTILEYDKPHCNDLHPMKLVKDGCPKNGIVLDLFGGSGTTTWLRARRHQELAE